MALFREIMAIFWLAFGLFFTVVGVVGILRLPDMYTRLHASGKVGTMGLLGILLGVGFLTGSFFKLLTLGLFMAIINPVNSHVIAKANRDYIKRHTDGGISSRTGNDGETPPPPPEKWIQPD
jgi:multicomponent Na+:H+ antiporter subunit G